MNLNRKHPKIFGAALVCFAVFGFFLPVIVHVGRPSPAAAPATRTVMPGNATCLLTTEAYEGWVEAYVTGTANCQQWVPGLAQDGHIWNYVTASQLRTGDNGTGTMPPPSTGNVCTLRYGPQELFVAILGDLGGYYDIPGLLCSDLEQDGWVPVEGS